MSQRSPRAYSAAVVLTGAALLLHAPFARGADDGASGVQSMSARAGGVALKVEPGITFPLTEPQSQLFDVGGGGTIKAMWPLTPFLDLGPSATFIALQNEASTGESGRAWAFGPSLRLKRPHPPAETDAFHSLSPWVDADALYVRTGDLNRAGFAVAAGVALPVGAARAFWIGPFVRYFQIIQEPERSGYDNRDAKLLSVGVSLEAGPGKVYRHCVDRDGDGVCAGEDRCPDVAGPRENWGCPPYKRLVVGPDKLELKEKLYFEWDQAILQDISFPVLDEVAQALKDNPSFRVQVEGHASSEGAYDYNQNLSEKRAEAVLDYLVAHGVGKERLISKGFSSSVPAASNVTEAGREQNRRVEFVVHFIILNEGSK